MSKLHLQHKIVLVLFLIILLVTGFSSIYFYAVVSSLITNQAISDLDQGLDQSMDRLQSSIKVIDISSLSFAANDVVRSWLSNDISFSGGTFASVENKIRLGDALSYSMMFNSAWDMHFITSAFLFINEDTYSSVSRGAEVRSNMDATVERYRNVYRRLVRENTQGLIITPPESPNSTLYFSRNFINPSNKGQTLFLVLGIDEGMLADKYQNLTAYKGSLVCVVDAKGAIYSSADKSQLGGQLDETLQNAPISYNIRELRISGESYFIAKRSLNDGGLYLIAGIPKVQVLARLDKNMRDYLYIIFAFSLVVLLAGMLMSANISSVIRNLLFHLEKVKEGSYDTRMPAYKDRDLKELSGTFNGMADEIGSLIREVYEKQLLLRESELKFLQSQIDPHFLFNTLISVSTMAKLAKQETIYQMVSALTTLLQASIGGNPRATIKISQELEYARLYLYIQKIRFDDMLNYEIEVEDPSVLDCYIPRLCVEPLVENSVVHGIEPGRRPGLVQVRVSRSGDGIEILIKDNGGGFNPERLMDGQTDRVGKPHNNIGLLNCDKRIKLLYGEPYGLSIESAVSMGTTVKVRIPPDEKGIGHV